MAYSRYTLSSYSRGVDARYVIGRWSAANVAANLTDSVLSTFDTRSIARKHQVFVPTLIHATWMDINTVASTTGTLTVSIFVDGADAGAAFDMVMSGYSTGDQIVAKSHSPPLVVAAGSYVDIRITTSAAWANTSADVTIALEAGPAR